MPRLARPRQFLARTLFDSRTFASLTGRSHVVVVGDSHVAVFEGFRQPGVWFSPTVVWGATASGIRNPNSRTEALARFKERFARIKSHQHVLVLLGEVDCGYLIWRRAERDGHEVSYLLDDTIARYVEFLREVASTTGAASVAAMSAPLPTLPDDGTGWGEIAQRRSDITASQAQRTELTIEFNSRLARRLRDEGFGFLDASSGLVDHDSQLIHSRFLRVGEADHHLRDAPYREVIARALRAEGLPWRISGSEERGYWAQDRALYPAGRSAWVSDPGLWAVAVYRIGRWARNKGGLPGVVGSRLERYLHLLMRVSVGVELPVSAEVGPGLRIFHQSGIVISSESRIGARCRLRQGVTIGVARSGGPSPTLGDDVFVGPYAQILGGVSIGDGAQIGALALVTRDVPAGASVRAQPGVRDSASA